MSKMFEVKIKHHYVSQEHLRNWSDDRKNIWHTTSKGKIANNGIRGLARIKNFYKLDPIDDIGEKFIHGLIFSNINENLRKTLYPFYKQVIKNSRTIRTLNDLKDIDETENLKQYKKIIESNTIENAYTIIENDIKKIQRKITESNDYIINEDDRPIISTFIIQQYFKTISAKEKIIDTSRESSFNFQGVREYDLLSRNWVYISFLYSLKMSCLLATQNYEIIILENKHHPLITSDQGSFNISKNFKSSSSDLLSNLNFYFPLSPNRALILSSNEEFTGETIQLSSDDVDMLNHFVLTSPHKTLFSSTKESLEKANRQKRHTSDTPRT